MRSPAISVILPTVRPHLIERASRSIPAACGNIPYEIVIVADFEAGALPLPPNTNWIVRGRKGVVDAVNVAYAAAKGTYIFLFNDESVLDANALEVLYHEAERSPRALLSPKHLPEFNFVYYGRFFAAFAFASRALLDELGGLLDPAYRGFYADPDLSMRAYARGVSVRVVEGAVLHHGNVHDAAHNMSVSAFLEDDRRTFRARWDHLGEFRDP